MNRTEFLEHLSDVCEVKPETIELLKHDVDILIQGDINKEGHISYKRNNVKIDIFLVRDFDVKETKIIESVEYAFQTFNVF